MCIHQHNQSLHTYSPVRSPGPIEAFRRYDVSAQDGLGWADHVMLAEKTDWHADDSARLQGLPEDASPERFREWNNLRYWFRGVERFAPWVRKVHFVTEGHVPEWLNLHHPKLNVVRHSDYIHERYLPTFSSRPMQISLHNIPDLTGHFV